MAPKYSSTNPATSIFTRSIGIPEDKKCAHYAEFMQNVSHSEAKIIFWVLFVLVVILLVTSSHFYIQSDKLRQALLQSENELKAEHDQAQSSAASTVATQIRDLEEKYKRKAGLCAAVTLAIIIATIACVAVEAYTLMNLMFCHKEDLMPFYWGAWTLIQISSTIAEIGLFSHQCHNYFKPDHPDAPWAVALGTPIPVICGIFNYGKSYLKSAYRKWFATPNIDLEAGLPSNGPAIGLDNLAENQTVGSHRSQRVSVALSEEGLVQIYEREPLILPPGSKVLYTLPGTSLCVVKHSNANVRNSQFSGVTFADQSPPRRNSNP